MKLFPLTTIGAGFCAIGVFVASILASSSLAQTVPNVINYQGRLTDTFGAPLAIGNYGLEFRLWDSPTNTTGLIWGQQQNVSVQANGVFNVILGAPGGSPLTNPVPAVNDLAFAFNAADRFLQLTVVSSNGVALPSPSPITPRQPMLSVPFAIMAQQTANGAIGSNQVAPNSIAPGHVTQELLDLLAPPGTIAAYMGTNAPVGWLLCDGSVVSRTQYARLFAAVGTASGPGTNGSTFHLPDLRGMFLRGVDSLRDLAFSASAVSVADDTIMIPSHRINHSGYSLQLTNSGGALPGGLLASNTYYAIAVDADSIKVATSESNALLGIAINLTSQGTGTNKLFSWADPDKSARTAMVAGGNIGSAVGTVQRDDFKSHTHRYNDLGSTGPLAGTAGLNTVNGTTGATGGWETRPKNVYVNYIIKY